MDALKIMIDLLLTNPSWPNTAIAARAGCERRRVRRYRRLLAESGLTAADLCGCDGPTLRALFNPRTTAHRHARPDFATLAAAHPGTSGRTQWNEYRRAAATTGEPLLSYSQFMRRRAEHLAMEPSS